MSNTVTVSTSVVLAPTKTTADNYIVYFPNISTNGRLITVRDNDGYASTNHAVILSTTAGARFATGNSQIYINQPFGFITLNSQSSGNYTILNTFAFPEGSAAAFVSQVTTSNLLTSTLQMVDVGTQSTNTFFTSTGFMYLNSTVMGQVSQQQLISTVAGLGTAGYISTVVIPPIVPALYIITGFTSNQYQSIRSPLGSIVYGEGNAPYVWKNGDQGYTSGFSNGGYDSVYGNPYIVACGDAFETASNTSYIQYSIDGCNWNYGATFLSSPQMRLRLSYANGLYHAVGSNGTTGGGTTILWSQNGISWNNSLNTPITPFNGGYARGITYGKGLWVAAGTQSGPAVFSLIYSSNGSNWYNANSGGGLSQGIMWDVAYNGDKFMAITSANSSGGSILISSDGKSWNVTATPGSNLNNGASAGGYIAANANMWIVTGSNGSPSGQMMFYSLNNGDSWTAVTSFATGSLSRPFWDGSQWWVGYYTPATPTAQGIYYSLDGSNWANTNTASGGFVGGLPRGFAFRNAQSNYSIALLSTVAGLQASFQTSTLQANTISTNSITAATMTVSSLFVNVQIISTTFETVNNISTMRVDNISAGVANITKSDISSINTNYLSAGYSLISSLGIGRSNTVFPLDVTGPQRIIAQGSNSYTRFGVQNPGADTLSLIARTGWPGTQATASLFFGNSNVDYPMARIAAVDVGTGTYRSELIIQTANNGTTFTERMRINSNGFLGINTSTPQTTLDVNGTASVIGQSIGYTNSNSGTLQIFGGGGNTYIQAGSNTTNGSGTSLVFGTINNTSQTLIVNTFTRRVGINNSIPATNLVVTAGGTTALTGVAVNSTDVNVVIGNYTPTNFGSIQCTSGGSVSAIGINPYPLFIQPLGGSVSIGSGSSNSDLNVNGITSLRSTMTYADRVRNPLPTQLRLETTTGTTLLKLGAYYTPSVGAGCVLQSTDFYSGIDHGDNLLINPLGGTVGINVSTPNTATFLHVAGTLGGDPTAQILIQGTGTTPNSALALSNASGWGQFAVAGGGGQYLTDTNAGDFLINTRTATKKFFLANNNVVGLVCSNGNIGIGTNAPNGKLEVQNNAILNSHTGTNIGMTMNSGNGQFGTIEAFQRTDGNVKKPLCLNPYGGKVGIGSTNPIATLDVTGGIRATDILTVGDTGIGEIGLSSGGSGVNSRGYMFFSDGAGSVQGSIGSEGNPASYISMEAFNGAVGYQVNSNFKVDYRVGIGLGSALGPSYELDVNGSANITSNLTVTRRVGLGGNLLPRAVLDIQNTATEFAVNRGTGTNLAFSGFLDLVNGPAACLPVAEPTAGTAVYFYYKNGNGNKYYTFVNQIGSLFTGQHKNEFKDFTITTSNVNEYVGLIVSSADEGYVSYRNESKRITGSNAIWTTEALPVIKLTDSDMDMAVWGVITNHKNDDYMKDEPQLDNQGDFNIDPSPRIRINGLGEGAIWVTNINGNFRNGEYICSSVIPGYGRRQDDDILHNYTVAKITMSCTFELDQSNYRCEEFEYNGKSYRKAYVGCTYHCS